MICSANYLYLYSFDYEKEITIERIDIDGDGDGEVKETDQETEDIKNPVFLNSLIRIMNFAKAKICHVDIIEQQE